MGEGGLGYSGQNSSSIYTPLDTTAGGGTGTQLFQLGSLGIGNTQGGTPTWVYIAGLAFAALLLWKRR